MTEDHQTQFLDNVPAYALGALDQTEAELLEAHLETCQICQAELAVYGGVTEGLLFAAAPMEPPPALREKLAAQLPAPERAAKKSWLRQLPSLSFGQLATAGVLVLLLGLNVFSISQTRELQRSQAELAQRMAVERSAFALLAAPDTQVVSISGEAQGSLLLNYETNSAVLIVWDLPQLSKNETYQMWLIDAQGNRLSGGVFINPVDQDYTLVQIDASSTALDHYVGFGVTVEPWGGSPGPTGPNVIKVDF